MSAAAPVLVERLYHRLVDSAAERSPSGPEFTVGEIYQQLIPYRGVRADLGILELAQYEDALLRLLAGEGGFVRITDENARREILAELSAPNPILGIYRDYAGVGVEIPDVDPAAVGQGKVPPLEGEVHLPRHATDHPAHAAADALRVAPPAPRPEPRGSSPIGPILFGSAGIEGPEGVASGPTGAPDRPEMGGPEGVAFGSTMEATDGALPTDGPVGGAARQEGPLDAARSTSVAGESQSCIACHELLPDHPDLRFCPHCGVDQSIVLCPGCDTPIQADWNFCIRCGSRRPLPASRPS